MLSYIAALLFIQTGWLIYRDLRTFKAYKSEDILRANQETLLNNAKSAREDATFWRTRYIEAAQVNKDSP